MEVATEKQVRYALLLLGRAGYSTRFMDGSFRRLGASMAQRQGRVEDWLRSLSVAEASALIDQLRAETEVA